MASTSYPAAAPYAPPFDATAYLHPDAHQTRVAQGGVPPYQYSSSNSSVASVDPITGHVVSTGIGSARISVDDTRGATVSYEVSCKNVYELVCNMQLLNHAQAKAWIASIGAHPFALDPQVNSTDPLAATASFSFQKVSDWFTNYWCIPTIVNPSGAPYSRITSGTGKPAQWQTTPFDAGIRGVASNSTSTANPSIGYRTRPAQ